MRMVCRLRIRTLMPLLFSLCCVGCARPLGNRDGAPQGGQPVPFRGDAGDTATVSAPSLAVPDNASAPGEVPFHAQTLPSGTLLSVRLNDAISSDGREDGRSFTATLDEPVVIDGKTVLPRGINVAGRVESAERSSPENRRGYIRLTLNSIELGGRDLSVSTSSLFAKGNVGVHPIQGQVGSKTVRLEQGRRLTFRLSEPLNLSSQVAISRR